MVRRLAALGLLLFSSVALQAQDTKYENFGQAYAFDSGSTAIVYDTANVRETASTTGAVLQRLNPGTLVTILSTGALLTLGNKAAPWCEVGYSVGNSRRRGFVWSGVLSPRYLSSGNTSFIYSVQFGKQVSDQSRVTVKAIRNDSILSLTSFVIGGESSVGLHEAAVKDNRGLKALKNVLRFYFSGEACAVPAYEQLIGWDGIRLVPFRQVSSVSDAGVGYADQQLILPADKGGKANEIRLKEESAEYDDNDKLINKKVKITRYRWVPAKGMVKL